jgi:hypothetical protein
MKNFSRFSLVCGSVVLLTAGTVAQATTFSLKAVKKNPTCIAGLVGEFCATDRQCDTSPGSLDGVCGGNITPTNNITARVGDKIVAEIYVSDWSPQGQKARTWQATIDMYSFFSGSSGAIVPVGWDRPLEYLYCEDNSDCPPEWPVCFWDIAFCSGPAHDPEPSALIDSTRADYIFVGKSEISAVDYAFYRLGSALLNPSDYLVYAPPPKYCATLALEVRPGSTGAFTVSLLEFYGGDPDIWHTFVLDERIYYVLPLVQEPLTITIRNWPIKVSVPVETE